MVLSFFTLCAGYPATRISCDGSTVPYTHSSIRLFSTSDSLLCLCSRILTSACVILPCAFHFLILFQARCNFISHDGTFLYTPEGRRGAATAHQHICSGQKGEKKLLQPLLISRSFTLVPSVQETALPRCCAMLLPVVHHRFTFFFLSVYICVYFSCAFCYIVFYVTARIYCFLLACIMTIK